MLDNVNNLIVTKFSLSLTEPMKVLGEIEGSGSDFNRLLSYLRERSGETDLLKNKLIEIEKSTIHKEYSGVDS